MLPLLSRTFQGLVAPVVSPFDLQTLKGFPYIVWNQLQSLYATQKSWYRGEPLLEKITDNNTNTQVDRYPIKINPIKGTAEKHTAVLFGTAVESLLFGTLPIRFKADLPEAQKATAEAIQEALLNVFEDSNGGALFIQNGITSQYMGGCVFWVSWKPEEDRFEISAPMPDEVMLIPDGMNYWSFREAWLIRQITNVDALAYGITDLDAANTKQIFYIEHWSRDTYSVQINDKFITPEQPNPFGVVPCMYIPHIRDGGFYGTSIITEAVKGIIREMNLRWADVGDAVSEDSHTLMASRNIHGTISVKKLSSDGRPILDLGSRVGLSGNEGDPDLFAVRTQSASQPMLALGDSLYDLYRIETNHPAVADGKDEGSQRSSLTLTTRMWPLVSHAELERILWTVGLKNLAKVLLTMMAAKGLNGITQEALKARIVIEWTTMLPKDRETLVNEVAVRSSSKLGSQQHLIEMLGDVSDIEEEMKRIQDEAEADAERAIKVAQANKPEPNPNKPGNSQSGNSSVSRGQVKKS